MGFTGHRRLFPFLLLLLFSAFLLPTTVHSLRPLTASPLPPPSVPDPIEAICNLTTHPSLCISAVTPHLPVPFTTTSVLLVLLQSAKNETATNMNTFSYLAKNPKTSPKMKTALNFCETFYGESLEDYSAAMRAVKAKDWDTALTHLSGIVFLYVSCVEGDVPGLPPVGDGPWIAFNRKLMKFVDDCFDLFGHLKRL